MRADVARNRQAILAAARAAFERGEFDRRFDDFAALAGVGVGTLYRHYPTRDALAEAVYREEVAALCQHAYQLLAEGPASEALTAFLEDFVSQLAAHSGLAQTLATLMRNRTAPQAEGRHALETAVADLVAAAVRDGTLDAGVTSGVVITALHGIGSSYGRPQWRDDAERLIAVLVGRKGLSGQSPP
jgi:AcrR family transcriptional regulator